MPSFRLDEHDKLAKYLDAKMAEGARKGLLSAGLRVVGVIQDEIIPAEKPPPIFDGAYRAAWRAESTALGADVVNDMPYAGVIEHGARAENVKIGRAMIDALTEWVRRKGLTGHSPGERSSPDARSQSRSIAWAIARAMQKKGIFNRGDEKGLGIAKKAVKALAGFVEEEVRREIRRAR